MRAPRSMAAGMAAKTDPHQAAIMLTGVSPIPTFDGIRMGKRIDNRKDILLLLLYSPGITESVNDPVAGRTRLTKMLFLFREEALQHFRAGTAVTAANFYEFFAWDFGPFSTQVYDDLLFFLLRGFVEATTAASDEVLPEEAAEWEKWTETNDLAVSEESFDFQEEIFRLTDKGAAFTKALYEQLSDAQQKLLREFKIRTTKVPLRALLQYVYSNYPDQIVKSKIREQVLGNYLV